MELQRHKLHDMTFKEIYCICQGFPIFLMFSFMRLHCCMGQALIMLLLPLQ